MRSPNGPGASSRVPRPPGATSRSSLTCTFCEFSRPAGSGFHRSTLRPRRSGSDRRKRERSRGWGVPTLEGQHDREPGARRQAFEDRRRIPNTSGPSHRCIEAHSTRGEDELVDGGARRDARREHRGRELIQLNASVDGPVRPAGRVNEHAPLPVDVQVTPRRVGDDDRQGGEPDEPFLGSEPGALEARLGVGKSPVADVVGHDDGPGCAIGYRLGPVLPPRSEEHTSELQSLAYLVCRLLLEKKKKKIY